MAKHFRAIFVGCVLAVGAISMRSTQDSDVHGAPPVAADQRAIVITAPDGTFVWTYPQSYAFGTRPIITSMAVAAPGTVEILNVQLDGEPTNTQAKFRVTTMRGTKPPGAIVLHVTARQPEKDSP